tara:strand:- start:2006 stop:3724 length:1719 start_codon:yes stop_codon:yes gene_type:complete
MYHYKRLWKILSRKEKKKSLIFFMLTFLNSAIETTIVLLVIPLTQILLSVDIELPYFGVIDYESDYSYSKLVVLATGSLLLIFLIKNIFIAYYVYWQDKFIGEIELRLSTKLLDKYIYRPYSYHLSSNTGLLANNVFNESLHVPGNIRRIGILTTEFLVLIVISAILIMFEPQGTMVIVVTSMFLSILFNILQKKYITNLGTQMFRYNGQSNKSLLEGLNNIKDIKLLNRENFFINNYYNNFKKAIRFKVLFGFFGQMPRSVFELVMVLSFFVLILFLVGRNDPTVIILTTSLFLIATYRLLPSLVRITVAYQTIQFRKNVTEKLLSNLLEYDEEIKEVGLLEKNHIKLKLNKEISLEGISFIYPQTTKSILNDVSLKIKKGEMIGVIGPSGSGKTTLIDVLLGLLKPTKGKITTDGIQINEKNIKSFQDIIGYVPQSPTFMDDTIKKNIAFGIEEKDIDNKLIEAAVDQANLKEFLEMQKDGINTVIGEKGVRISGGQKQRISIARALYKNPEILIFDEATSSLDEKNESEIVNNISLVKKVKTIIVVAHKISILENCDKILKLKDGRVHE